MESPSEHFNKPIKGKVTTTSLVEKDKIEEYEYIDKYDCNYGDKWWTVYVLNSWHKEWHKIPNLLNSEFVIEDIENKS